MAPFLISREHDDTDWRRVVRNLDRRLTHEMSYDEALGSQWDEAWVWGGTAPYGSHWSLAAFHSHEIGGWLLARVYLVPHMRRRGT